MRWLHLVPVVVLLAACGGSALDDSKGAPNAAGAAGAPIVDGAASSGAASENGGAVAAGAPASSAGAGTGGRASGGSAGALGEAGSAGGGADAGAPALPGCQGLDCLAGAEWVYWPDREWQRPTGNPASNELLEADYKPKMAPAWDVKFSSDALQVVLTPRAGGNAVQGTRDTQYVDRAWFAVSLAVGGRFVVQVGAQQFQAEFTAYGSGVPIVSSTRGALQAP